VSMDILATKFKLRPSSCISSAVGASGGPYTGLPKAVQEQNEAYAAGLYRHPKYKIMMYREIFSAFATISQVFNGDFKIPDVMWPEWNPVPVRPLCATKTQYLLWMQEIESNFKCTEDTFTGILAFFPSSLEFLLGIKPQLFRERFGQMQFGRPVVQLAEWRLRFTFITTEWASTYQKWTELLESVDLEGQGEDGTSRIAEIEDVVSDLNTTYTKAAYIKPCSGDETLPWYAFDGKEPAEEAGRALEYDQGVWAKGRGSPLGSRSGTWIQDRW